MTQDSEREIERRTLERHVADANFRAQTDDERRIRDVQAEAGPVQPRPSSEMQHARALLFRWMSEGGEFTPTALLMETQQFLEGTEPRPVRIQTVATMSKPAPEIIMDANGNYWRRYDTHLSMVPTTDDNEITPEPYVVYRPAPDRDALKEALLDALRYVTLHVRKAPWGDGYWSHTVDANSLHRIVNLALDALTPTQETQK